MRWPHYDHIFFDCDSTLTTVEGIDILAESVGKRWRVEVLTQAAMDGELDLEDVYGKRLQAVKPTRQQVRQIRQVYKRHVVEDATAVIHTLQSLGHNVYIISGGLAEPVVEFGLYLGVPRQNIRAVSVNYNQLSGHWWKNIPDQDRYLAHDEGALTVSDGKAQIVRELLGEQHGRSLLIGDGYSDLMAGTAVDLFVGFGGVISRERVRANAPAFIHSASLAPLLALAASPAALIQLQTTEDQLIASKALNLIKTGAITFNDEQLKTKFNAAFHAAHQTIHSRSH
ncbi:MAG: HAD-IB family phosphatase [Ardenticatenaceae bacterium]|nr:HAD-IB family phosphatase [Anaerolineales bacterium]MCB8922729.1 HAD-IB family phosphatase [Ardenticatenaceae bacterium]MCB9003566.1 HAD-IB family phosphatase [Ardenticatenaceae bacterium]